MRPTLFLLAIIVTMTAWLVARRDPKHRAVFYALAVYLGSSVLRAVLLTLVPARGGAGLVPLAGVELVARHADRILFLAWPAAVAALALHVFARWGVAFVAAGYVASAVVLVHGYPELRFEALRQFYGGCLTAMVGVTALAFLAWVHARRPADVTVKVTGLLCVALATAGWMSFSGAHVFDTSWDLTRASYVVLLSGVLFFHVREIWSHNRPMTAATAL